MAGRACRWLGNVSALIGLQIERRADAARVAWGDEHRTRIAERRGVRWAGCQMMEQRGYPVDLRTDGQRWRAFNGFAGDFEYAAARVIARLTGERVITQDDNSSPGIADIRIEYEERPAALRRSRDRRPPAVRANGEHGSGSTTRAGARAWPRLVSHPLVQRKDHAARARSSRTSGRTAAPRSCIRDRRNVAAASRAASGARSREPGHCPPGVTPDPRGRRGDREDHLACGGRWWSRGTRLGVLRRLDLRVPRRSSDGGRPAQACRHR
jgi:hypothetical protein